MPQRSPINFWLLLAATICVDAVTMVLMYAGAQEPASLFIAMVFAQISALCVWALFSRGQQLARLISPFALAIAAALWMGLSSPRYWPDISFEQITLAHCGLWLTHAAGLMSLLWALKRTTYARRWNFRVDTGVWQFSIKHLLIVMTTVAVLIFILRSADLIHEVWMFVVVLIANNGGLALACVLIQGTAWHAILRLAAIAAVAVLFGALLHALGNWDDAFVANLIHAFVLFLWLEVGGILPARGPASAIATDGASQ
jgi:hypothetical protein